MGNMPNFEYILYWAYDLDLIGTIGSIKEDSLLERI
jgi:hypothetical protein